MKTTLLIVLIITSFKSFAFNDPIGQTLVNKKTKETLVARCLSGSGSFCYRYEFVLTNKDRSKTIKTFRSVKHFYLSIDFMRNFIHDTWVYPERKFTELTDYDLPKRRYVSGHEFRDALIILGGGFIAGCKLGMYIGCPLVPIGIALDLAKAPFVVAGVGLYNGTLATFEVLKDFAISLKANRIIKRTKRNIGRLLSPSKREKRGISDKYFKQLVMAIELGLEKPE